MLSIPRWQLWAVLVVTILGVLFSTPNFLPQTWLDRLPTWFSEHRMALGLDLQGGAHFLLEVDVRDVLRQRMTDEGEAARGALRTQNIRVQDVSQVRETPNGRPYVVITLRDVADRDKAITAIRNLDASFNVTPEGTDGIRIAFTDQAATQLRQQVLDQSMEVVRRRVDETGTKEINLQRQGDERILLQLPGLKDPGDVERILNKTAKMNFHLVNEDIPANAAQVPASTMLIPTREGMEELRKLRPDAYREIVTANPPLTGDRICQRFQPQCLPILKRIVVSGENLVDSQATFEQQNSRPIVSFRFDQLGGRQFCRISGENIGKRLAIILDNEVISAPVIQGAICGNSGIITGSFTTQQTNDLSRLLRSGALPATLTIIERRTVGPDLGADSINAGAIACVIGYLLIAVLIVVSYGFFGLLANICLLLNILFTFAIMSALGATLTLPGLAGIVLGIAMAVDANVLVFERMREETRAGRTPISAIDAAFRRAYVTITDSNLTTLFAAIFLYALGSGPVRGFAVTLGLGIMCSMFTAVTVARMMIALWVKRARPRELPI
jgi:preprotein translocase subunit SecD